MVVQKTPDKGWAFTSIHAEKILPTTTDFIISGINSFLQEHAIPSKKLLTIESNVLVNSAKILLPRTLRIETLEFLDAN
jgi:hypothetical protein